MPGDRTVRIAVFAAVATLLGGLALTSIIDGVVWFWQSIVTVAVITAAGEAVRRHGLPRVLAPMVQLAALLGWLTLLYARQQAFLGVLPGEAVWARFLAQAQAASIDASQYAAPVPDKSAIVAVAVGGLGLVAIAVDLLAATLRRSALAGLPLLALYVVPVTVFGEAHPLLFILTGAGYLGLLAAERRSWITRYGRLFGTGRSAGTGGRGLAGSTSTQPGRGARLVEGDLAGLGRSGRRIGAVVLALGVAVPAVLPAVLTQGVLSPEQLFATSNGTAVGVGGRGPSSVRTIDPTVSLYRNLNLAENIPLLRVRTNDPNGRDAYLRLVALDRFDGVDWTAADRDTSPLPKTIPLPAELGDDVARHQVSTSVEVRQHYRSEWLPVPKRPTKVSVEGDWRYDARDGAIVGSSGQTTAGLGYRVRSVDVTPTREQLQDAGKAPDEIRDRYTQLPGDLPPIVERLAKRVTKGAKTPYEQAMALQEWFLDPNEFVYDTTVRSDGDGSPLAQFLRDRVGYCQQFAGTMAVMARLLGIPARVVVGFTPGVLQPDGSYVVGAHDAHAWPELYFSGVGWVRFEPTPTVGDGRGSVPSWATEPVTGGGSPGSGTEETTPLPAPTADEGSQSSASRADVEPDAAAAPRKHRKRAPAETVPVRPLAAGAAVLLLASLPLQIRLLVRRRRVGAGPDPVLRAQAAWAELGDQARDLGYRWRETVTVRQAASLLAADAGLEPPHEQAMRRLVAATERARYAAVPDAQGDPFADVRVLRAALAARRGGLARARARMLPPTVFAGTARLLRGSCRRLVEASRRVLAGWSDLASDRLRTAQLRTARRLRGLGRRHR